VIELGRGQVEPRLARFAAAWPQVAAAAAGATHADLRYPGGFALRGVAVEERRSAPKGRRA
jgi:cell division septal protein FtsQ